MIKEIIIKVADHIENMEEMFETNEFTENEVLEYIENLELENEENFIEVIPATRKEFRKGILCTVRYEA